MKWTISGKLIAGFLAVSSLIAVAGFFGIFNIGKMGDAINRIAKEEVPIADAAMEMQLSVAHGSNALAEYKGASTAITNTNSSVMDEFEEEFRNTIEEFDEFSTGILKGAKLEDGSVIIRSDNDNLVNLVKEAEKIHDDTFQPAAERLILAGKNLVAADAVAREAMLKMEGIYEDVIEVTTLLEESVDRTVNEKKKNLSRKAKLILERDVPIADAVMELKMTLAQSRIVLEEVRQSNDLNEITDLEKELSEFSGSFTGYTEAILNGGVIEGKQFYASDDAEIRDKVSQLQGRYDELKEAAETLTARQRELISLSEESENAMETVDEAVERLGELLANVEVLAGEEMYEAVTKADDAQSSANMALILVTVVGVVLGIVIGVVISRSITIALGKVVDMIKDIAQGEGDLTKRLEVTSKDEIGELATWFNRFVEKLHDIIAQVKGNANEVASAATEIASAAEQASAGAAEQEAQTGEVSTSVEQMAATILESSQNATSATESAQNAASKAAEGGGVVQQTIEGMQAIAESVRASAGTISELGKRSDEIGEIIEVIDDIADQTNLLALNAAIEAARAGEQGRGFAVVADEVRKLAERTTKATAEIASMIKGIQEDTGGAVASMEEGTKQVESGSELAAKAGDSLNEIVSVVSEVQMMIEQIATAADEQSSAAEQISGNVGNIATVTRQSAQGAEQMAATSEELNRQTESLLNLVGQFKLVETSSS